MPMNDQQRALCESHDHDFSGLSAIFLNCTLKRSGEVSNTEALMSVARDIMAASGVETQMLRPVDLDLAPGVQPDMTEHGFARDDWPALCRKVLEADILVLGTPIWLGEKSSVCTRVIERLYAESGKLNEQGQFIYYGRVGGCVVTGNEDGIKHCVASVLHALQHIGYTVPPQAEAGWVGDAGPRPSYADEDSGGPQNEFTQRGITFMSWNLMHMAKLLRDAGGMPAHGNQRSLWDAGCRFDHPNPGHR